MPGKKNGCMIGCGVLLVIGMVAGSINSCEKENSSTSDFAARRQERLESKKRIEEEIAKFNQMSTSEHLIAIDKAVKDWDLDLASKHLGAVPNDNSQKQKYIEKIKIAATAKFKKELQEQEAAALENRKIYANKLEEEFLDKGMNVDVYTQGTKSDRLVIRWALTSKVAAHELGKGEIIPSAKSLGFKRVTLTNGFKSQLGETWDWDLVK